MRWFGRRWRHQADLGIRAAGWSAPAPCVSEHAFGNALDVAGFTLADGRKITVKNGWHGTPEEQGFLHDVQR